MRASLSRSFAPNEANDASRRAKRIEPSKGEQDSAIVVGVCAVATTNATAAPLSKQRREGGGAPMIAPGRRLARVSGHSSGSWVVKISSLPFGPPICSLVSLAEPELGAGAIFTSAPIARFVSMARRYLARPAARCRGRDQV